MKNISLNFGSIKDTVFKYSSKQIVSEGKIKSFIDDFKNELTNIPVLKIQNIIYKNLEAGIFKKEYLAERYLNQNLDLIKNFDWNTILKENKELRVKILQNFHVESDPRKQDLYESIHSLIKAKTMKNFTDFDEENKAYEFIVNYLTREPENSLNENENYEEEEFPKFLSWNYVTKLAVNNFNERYSHLNESEQKLLKILLSDQNYKLNYFSDLKQENIELINNLLNEDKDSEIKNDLLRFKNKIESLNENLNIDDSIINLYELNIHLKD